jgi:apolipoprotein N-acyltransferase
MARLVKAWPCLASALLVTAAFPPFNLGLLVFVALAPWLLSLRQADGKAGFRSGWTFGFFMMLTQIFWMFSFIQHWTHSPVLAFIPYVLGSAFAGLYFAIVGWQIALCFKNNVPWAIPLVWVGMEVFRSYIPGLAFPYSLIAMPLWSFPVLIQLSYYGSIFLVSAWVVLANVIVVKFLAREAQWGQFRSYVGVFLISLVFSWIRFGTPVEGEKATITVAQPGIDLAFSNEVESNAKLAEIVPRFFADAKLQGADLLLLPEGVAGPDGSFPPKPVFQVAEGVPVVFGGQRGTNPRHQTAFGYDGTWSYADKTRLVIFGEYVPLREQLPFLADAFQLPGGDLVPGDEVKAIKVGKLKVGPILCFEGLFPDISYRQAQNGAQLLTVMSVDDWYFGTTAPDQLRANAVWRAVETGRSLIRSASLGYSMAVDPQGRIVAELPTRVSRTMRVELPLSSVPPFQGFAVFPLLSLASLVLVPIGLQVVKSRKSQAVNENREPA